MSCPVVKPSDDIGEDEMDALRRFAGGERMPHAVIQLQRFVFARCFVVQQFAHRRIRHLILSTMHRQERQ